MLTSLFTRVKVWHDDLRGRATEEGGATAVEYALMVALIAAVIIVSVTLLGNNADTKFDSVADAVGS
ncbi:MAG: Flp family type IVb pilin [Actinomycetota bacterium]